MFFYGFGSKAKNNNTTLSQFQNPKDKFLKNAKSIPLKHNYMAGTRQFKTVAGLS
jgi:hypothetical protein